jgi:hypothetical protein
MATARRAKTMPLPPGQDGAAAAARQSQRAPGQSLRRRFSVHRYVTAR